MEQNGVVAGHECPHVPQLLRSDVRSRQPLGQLVSPPQLVTYGVTNVLNARSFAAMGAPPTVSLPPAYGFAALSPMLTIVGRFAQFAAAVHTVVGEFAQCLGAVPAVHAPDVVAPVEVTTKLNRWPAVTWMHDELRSKT